MDSLLFDELKNLDIERCSDSELKAWIKQTIPVVITFVRASQRFFSEKNRPNQGPCKNCDKFKTCQGSCDLLESKLPGALSGSHILNNTCGDLLNVLGSNDDSDSEPTSRDTSRNLSIPVEIPLPDTTFKLYENCQWKFPKKQWEAIYMKFKLGKQNVEIASLLKISQSSVCDRLRRARNKMEQHYKKKKGKKFDERNLT